MTARAERARTAIRADRQNVRMTIDQPLGRRRGRRAHDDLQTGCAEYVDRAIQPAPVIFAGRGLDPAPRKFGDPHLLDAECFHPASVVFPHRLRPVFRVITDSKAHPNVLYA